MLVAIRSPRRRSLAAARSELSPSDGNALPVRESAGMGWACTLPGPFNSRQQANAMPVKDDAPLPKATGDKLKKDKSLFPRKEPPATGQPFMVALFLDCHISGNVKCVQQSLLL